MVGIRRLAPLRDRGWESDPLLPFLVGLGMEGMLTKRHERMNELGPRCRASCNLHSSTVICLPNRKWKKTQSGAGQNRFSRCEMV
jgi:hypothetical protein